MVSASQWFPLFPIGGIDHPLEETRHKTKMHACCPDFIGDVGVSSSGLRLADIGAMKLRHSLSSGPTQKHARPSHSAPLPHHLPRLQKYLYHSDVFRPWMPSFFVSDHHMTLLIHDATCLMTPGAMVKQAISMSNFSLATTIFGNHFAVHATRIVRMCPNDLVQKFPSAPSKQRGRRHKCWDQTLASFSCIVLEKKSSMATRRCD